jgi:predicted membrane protein
VKKAAWPYLAAIALLALLLVAPLGTILTLRFVPGSPDSVTPMALSRALEALQVRTGSYPLWAPWSFSGMPTVEAFSYLSGLYLPNQLFGLLHLDPMYIQLLHLVFAGMGGFLLSRQLGLGSIAAFLTGSAFMLNPYMTAMLAYGHGSQLMTAAYMPWALWAALRLAERGGFADAGLLALMLGLQLQRAHVQIAWYTWMLVVPLLVVKILFDSKPGVPKWNSGSLAIAALALGVAIALQVYLPALGYLPASSRSGAGDPAEAYRYATLWSMHPAELLTYLLPGAFGFGGATYWGFMPFTDFPHYAGLAVLGFAIAGVVAGRKKPMVLFLTAMTALALLLSFGNFFSPVYDLFYHFAPKFSSFRVPSMVLVVVALCLSLLAGYGLQAWLDKPLEESSPLLRWGAVAIGLNAFFFLFLEDGLEQRIRSSFPTVRIDNADLVAMVNNLRWELWYDSLFVLISAAALLAGILWLVAKKMIGAKWAAIALVALSCTDLIWIDQRIVSPDERSLRASPLVERASLDRALEGDDVTRFLASRPGAFRIYPVGQLFGENKFSLAGIESTGGYHAAKLGVYQELLARTDNLANLDVLRMLNVGYVLSPAPIDNPALKPVFAGKLKLVSGDVPVAVYELAGTMPRAWFAPWASATQSDREAIEAVMSGRCPDGGVFMTGTAWQGTKRFSTGAVLVMQRSAESISLKVRAEGDALLAVSEVFYPERWKLTVDGHEQQTLKVDGVIRGVLVPAGEHEVRFVYDRSRFETGRMVSLVATLLSLALIITGVITVKGSSATSKSSSKP